jgi:hypothetical protein
MIRAGHDFEANLSTGKISVIVEPTDGLCGFAVDKPSIVIRHVSVDTKDYLNTCAHELLHQSLPKASESEIDRIAGDVCEVLWKRGYRLPRTRKRR